MTEDGLANVVHAVTSLVQMGMIHCCSVASIIPQVSHTKEMGSF